MRRFVPMLAASALLLWSVVLVVQVLVLIFRYQVVVPIWDQWYEVTPAQHLNHLLRRHGEHVIAIPRLIFILDQLLAEGKNTFSMAAIFVVQALHALLLAALYDVSQGRSRVTASSVAMVAFLLAGLFSLAQWENLVSGFQIGFVGVYFLATLALAALALRRPGWVNDIVVGLIGVAACLTIANGILVPVFVLALAFWLRLPRPSILRLAFAGAIGWAIFGWAQLHPPTNGEPLRDATFHLGPAILAFAGILGRAFVRPDGRAAIWIGACGIAIVTMWFAKWLFAGFSPRQQGKLATDDERARSSLLTVTLFCLASAAAIAAGRVSFGAQALTTRYATPAIVFWSSLTLLVITSFPRRLRTGAAILVAIGACLSSTQWLKDTNWIVWDRAAYFAPLETAMLADVPDWLAFTQTGLPLKVERTAVRQTPELRKAGLSVFADPWAEWLGKPLPNEVLMRESECLGAVEGVVEVAPGAWRLTGWSSVGSRLLVLDDRAVVVGYAKPSILRLTAGHQPGDYGWVGHARGSPGQAISIIALFPDGRDACRLTTGSILREQIGEEVFAPSEFGPIRVSLEGGWIKGNGAVEGRAYSLDGDFFESRHGSDLNVGHLSMAFHLSPQDTQFQLPYTTDYPRDIGVRLRLAASGATVAEWQFPPSAAAWATFHLPVPGDVLHSQSPQGVDVLLDVVDYGSAWGQWVAVGLPRKSLNN